MDFFEKMGDAISETGRDITQKVVDLTELTKLRVDIRRKEESVQRLYREIGRQYYDLHKNDEEPLFEEVELITEMLGELLEMKKAAAQFKGKRVCPDCGAANDDDALFCKKCGARCEDEDAGNMEEADAQIVAEMEKAEEADAQIAAEMEKAKKVDVETEDIEDYKG